MTDRSGGGGAQPPAAAGQAALPAPPPQRRKVPFEKGFSQMDWVRLTQTHPDLAGLGGGPPRRGITLEEVAQHASEDDCWTVLRGKVGAGGCCTAVRLAGRRLELRCGCALRAEVLCAPAPEAMPAAAGNCGQLPRAVPAAFCSNTSELTAKPAATDFPSPQVYNITHNLWFHPCFPKQVN